MQVRLKVMQCFSKRKNANTFIHGHNSVVTIIKHIYQLHVTKYNCFKVVGATNSGINLVNV